MCVDMWTLSKTRHLEAELLSTTNVILPVAGADYVGPLPAELQGYVDFAVGVRGGVEAARRRAGAGRVHAVARSRAPHPRERDGATAALIGRLGPPKRPKTRL